MIHRVQDMSEEPHPTLHSSCGYFFFLIAAILVSGCCSTNMNLRSGENVAEGMQDTRITVLRGPASATTSPFPTFTAETFAEARASTSHPVRVRPATRPDGGSRVWIPSLDSAPLAKWIAASAAQPGHAPGLAGGGEKGSTLYAMVFSVPCRSLTQARLDSFWYAVDNELGDPPGDIPSAVNPIGVYVNGIPVPGFSDPHPEGVDSFNRQTELGPARIELNAGPENVNTLYVYQRDQGRIGGIIFEARLLIKGCAEF